jgi:hypothetical protein
MYTPTQITCMTTQQLEAMVQIYSSPFTVRLVAVGDGCFAAWPMLRDVDTIPDYLHSDTIRGAYMRYINFELKIVKHI